NGALAGAISARRAVPLRGLEQHDQRAVSTVGRTRMRESQDLAALQEPCLRLRLQHGLAAGRAVALAVNDADAAQAGLRRVANELGEALARGVAAQAVQV